MTLGEFRKGTKRKAGESSKQSYDLGGKDEISMRGEDGLVRKMKVLSPHLFNETVRAMSIKKVVAICEIGFGSIQMIGSPTLHPKVCQLMVEGLDPLNEVVNIHGQHHVISAKDFARIMGINDGGCDIELSGKSDEDLVNRFKLRLAGGGDAITIATLREIVVERNEADNLFVMGFILYAMATLLCPVGGEEVESALLFAIMDSCYINSQNWATYAFQKLIMGVLMFKSGKAAALSGCMLFLQVFYFDSVNKMYGWVDKNARPLCEWGDDQVFKLLKWVEDHGGVCSSNCEVWVPTLVPRRMIPGGNAAERKGTDKWERCGEAMAVEEEVEQLKMGFVKLEEAVVVIMPEIATMKEAVVRMSRLVGVHDGERIEHIVSQVVSRLNDGGGNKYDEGKNKNRNISTSHKRDKGVESTQFNHGREREEGSGSYSLKVLHVNKGEHGDGTRRRPHDLCTKGKGEPQASDRSAVSVSPTGPPKAVHRRTKEKTQRPRKVISKRYVRKLFTKSPSRVAANFLHGRQRVTINRKKEGVLAGPFMVNRDTSDTVVEMLKFVFMPRPLTAKMARYDTATVARYAYCSLHRDDLEASLAPDALVCSHVINMFATYLNEPQGHVWFFHTYFGGGATNFEVSTGYLGWEERMRSECRLNDFAPRLKECTRIFIPLRDPAGVGHWYMLVVKPKAKTAEIVDSYPGKEEEPRRKQWATNALVMLDAVFKNEIVAAGIQRGLVFKDFTMVDLVASPRQEGVVDCGVYLIRNMQNYGRDLAKKYVSEDHRASLVMECIGNNRNEVDNLEEMMVECLHNLEQLLIQQLDGRNEGVGRPN